MAQAGQAEHYDQILADYERHYYDESSMRYRERYIYSRLFADVDLSAKRVVELACGSGFNTQALLRRFPDVDVVGLDISPLSCEAYKANTGRASYVFDLTSSEQSFWPEPADYAFVVGGLHHCVRDLSATFVCLSRLIKPGGGLLMVEPNAAFFLNGLRMHWYREDKWFQEQDEAPLLHRDMVRQAGSHFVPEMISFLGGPAYFLILNSLILRFPLRLKRVFANALFVADDIYNRLPGSAPFPMFIARWRRTNVV